MNETAEDICIATLPEEVLEQVLTYCQMPSILYVCMRVNRIFYQSAKSILFKSITFQSYPQRSLFISRRVFLKYPNLLRLDMGFSRPAIAVGRVLSPKTPPNTPFLQVRQELKHAYGSSLESWDHRFVMDHLVPILEVSQNLKSLGLSGCHFRWDQFEQLISLLGGLKIQYLDLSYSGFKGQILINLLKEMKEIRVLDLSGILKLGRINIESLIDVLTSCPFLKILRIEDCPDAGKLSALKRELPHVQIISDLASHSHSSLERLVDIE